VPLVYLNSYLIFKLIGASNDQTKLLGCDNTFFLSDVDV
ncbi:uncharacterized protein METZ01_LOCUS248285, partial [marine metagenome]